MCKDTFRAAHFYMNLKGLYRNLCQKCGDVNAFATQEIFQRGATCGSAVLQSPLAATNICSNVSIDNCVQASTVCRSWAA